MAGNKAEQPSRIKNILHTGRLQFMQSHVWEINALAGSVFLPRHCRRVTMCGAREFGSQSAILMPSERERDDASPRFLRCFICVYRMYALPLWVCMYLWIREHIDTPWITQKLRLEKKCSPNRARDVIYQVWKRGAAASQTLAAHLAGCCFMFIFFAFICPAPRCATNNALPLKGKRILNRISVNNAPVIWH